MSKPIHILFLCVANSARSQLAEGLAKSIFGEDAIIESAGSEPSGQVQPWAIAVLKEQGIDISKNGSKSTEDLPLGFLANMDYVITLCAEEVCPMLPSGAKRLHWPIKDPAGVAEDDKADAFRQARDQIKAKILEFKKIN
jgi:arsenate reductase